MEPSAISEMDSINAIFQFIQHNLPDPQTHPRPVIHDILERSANNIRTGYASNDTNPHQRNRKWNHVGHNTSTCGLVYDILANVYQTWAL